MASTVSPTPLHDNAQTSNWQTLGIDPVQANCKDAGVPFRFGPARLADGRVRFRLWAPDMTGQGIRLEVAAMPPVRMIEAEPGWFEAVAACCDDARYWFRLDDGAIVPDPASRMQAEDVHGASVLCLPREDGTGSFAWKHREWRGRPWHEAVIYEMHVGLYDGYAGATAELHRLAALGFTAIELMPLAEFPGRRNWGYDGVLPFAPECSYGSPDALRTLIDTAHGLGLMVLLDVVYNHFGPDGNYLHRYASAFFRTDQQTPWGPAIDFRHPEVRCFFSENARYWLDSFRFDGLRLDAVHAIVDAGWLADLASELRACLPDRHVHLVLENDHNDVALLQAGYDAQWNDDAHHALHVLLTGENHGYYSDFTAHVPGTVPDTGNPALHHLARVLSEGFAWQGEVSAYRSSSSSSSRTTVHRGQPSAELPPTSFVMFLQNHDQTGNRAFGERLATLAEPDALRAAVAMQLLCPQIPLVFMGEEFGAHTPFLFFTDHPPELAQATREGRRREIAASLASYGGMNAAPMPDPNAPETFEASRAVCDDSNGNCRAWLHYYGELLSIRRHELMPRLPNTKATGVTILGEKALVARWRLGDGSLLSIWLNLGEEAVIADRADCDGGRSLHASQPGAMASLAAGTLPAHCCVTCLLDA